MIKHRNYLMTISVAACLAGCGHKGDQPSQVVAKVNDAEITISQLRVALQSKDPGTVSPADARKAIDGLIDQQLLVDAATQNKLDRDPQVVQTLEAMQREVLARAYIERMVFPREEASAADQVAYYKQHPELFQQRRIYELVAFSLPRGALEPAFASELTAARTPERIAELLKARSLAVESQKMTRAAEQLPFKELAVFQAAHVGDAIVSVAGDGARTLLWIAGVQEMPLSLEKAQPIVEQFLANRRKQEALQGWLKQARVTSNIAYQ